MQGQGMQGQGMQGQGDFDAGGRGGCGPRLAACGAGASGRTCGNLGIEPERTHYVTDTTPLEALLKRDRLIVIAGLASIFLLSWIYILLGAGMGMTALEMTRTVDGPARAADGMVAAAMTPVAWTPGYAVVMLFMWWIMMVAMMVPSAAPMLLLFASVNRKQREAGGPFVATGIFAAGYLLAWGGFSLIAVALQWALERAALLSAMMASSSMILGALLLIAAGAYQLSPLKQACLKHCRSPLSFVMHRWRQGRRGALAMGLEHGAFCLGCCWFLMGLLFYGGVMNLYWIAGLALFVLLEKTLPAGHRLGSLAGVGLITWGGMILLAAL